MSRPARDTIMRCRSGGPVIGSLAVNGATIRRRLVAGDPLIGTVVSLPDVVLAELTASAVQFVWIDLEHGALSARDVAPLAIAAGAAGAASLARVGGPEAELAVERLRYPPRGTRGMAARRGSGYSGESGCAGAEPVCMVQIESVPAVDEAEAIAEVDGVDALVVGCADLALDMGEDLTGGAPGIRDAIGHVQRACSAAGIASGIAGPDDPE